MKADDRATSGGLSASGLTDKTEAFSFLDIEGDIVNRF